MEKKSNMKKLNTIKTHQIICIVGPSASGKTTLVRNYIKTYNSLSNPISEILSTTTRNPRCGEFDGVDYNFVDLRAFHKLSKIEQAEYSGEFYGISEEEILGKIQNNTILFAVVSIEGVICLKRYIKDRFPEIKVDSVFLDVPSNILIDRMVNRGDKIDKIQQRIKNMRKNDELKNGLFCNFTFTPTNPGIYDPKICVEEFYQFIKRNF